MIQSEVNFILILFFIGLIVVILVSLLPNIRIVHKDKIIENKALRKYKDKYPFAVDFIEYYEKAVTSCKNDEELLLRIDLYLSAFNDTSIDMYVMGLYTGEAYLPDPEYFEGQVDKDIWLDINTNLEVIEKLNKISYNNFKYKNNVETTEDAIQKIKRL